MKENMIENRIKTLETPALDFEALRGSVRENLVLLVAQQSAAEKQVATKQKLPYMRAIRAVCYTLCVCMAATFLALALHNGSFDWMIGGPGIDPAGSDSGVAESETIVEIETEDTHPPALISPSKWSDLAKEYDQFLAFASYINPNVIINSDLLNDADKEEFTAYAREAKSRYYMIYMGTKDGVDRIRVIDWTGGGRFDFESSFEFESNLNYRYEDVISEFEKLSGIEITDAFLTEGNGDGTVLTDGIYLKFKERDGRYIPYYESAINDKAYIVDLQEEALNCETVENVIVASPFEMTDYFALGRGFFPELDEATVNSFDRFLSFTLFVLSDLESSDISFLSEQDREIIFTEYTGPANQIGYVEAYLGIMDGKDIVLIRNPYNGEISCFESNLEYSYEDVFTAFEELAGVSLTDDFLTAHRYDSNLYREIGGISLGFMEMRAYFKAEINGKIYVVDMKTE